MSNDFIKIPSFLGENGINLDGLISPADCGLCEQCEQCGNCEIYCTTCETCMPSCQTCLTCQNCQTTCEKNCQNCEGVACQTSQSPATNAVLTISSITVNSCLATITGLDSSVSYVIKLDWYAYANYKGSTYTTGTSSSKTITGLSSGTTYLIRVEIFNDDTHEFLDYLQKQITTLSLPKLSTPTLDTTQTVKTGNSISITINSVSGATTYYARINGGSQQSSSGRTFTFSGLLPNTQYLIEIKVGGSGYEDSDWAGYLAITLAYEPWEWMYPKTQNTEFNVTAAEWIAFCNKIDEVRTSKAMSGYTTPSGITKGYSFTAYHFRSAATAINQINGQVMSACLNVQPGDDILASYFTNLKTALNNAISTT